MSRFLEAAVLDESLRIVSLWLLPKGVAEVHLMVVDEDHRVGRHLVSWSNITSVSLTLSHRRPLTRYGGVPVGHVGHDGGAGVAHRLVEGGLNGGCGNNVSISAAKVLELQTKVCEDFVITEKAPTR